MLIEFSVANFRSIRERQTLSMAAAKPFKEQENSNTFDIATKESLPRLLRSAAIYGPNASGKTNLVRAMHFMEELVLDSAKESQAEEVIDVQPFKLSAASREADSEFEVIFVEDDVRYQFGFSVNQERVTQEWLFSFPEGRRQTLYQRAFNKETLKDEYKFSRSFLGGRRQNDWKESTRPNALFLSTAVQLNNQQLLPIYSWFNKRLAVIKPGFLDGSFTVKQCIHDNDRKKIIDFIKKLDISIEDIIIESKKFDSNSLPKDLPKYLRDEISKDLTGKEISEVFFMHKDTETGELIRFDLKDESEGTQNLFSFAGPWLDILEKNKVIFVDELEQSLHPLVVHQLIKLLHHDLGSKAQLIFTTHDTSLLSQKILRRDQIWFVEKDKKQASTLYSLSDYTNVRSDEAIEKGYLAGRYGAIPFIEDFYIHG